MKEEIIRNILNGMHLYLSSEQLRQLENVILTVLINYDFVEKKQEIIEKNTGWQFDLRDFLVQKKIEGKSEKTLKQYKYQLFKLLSSINKKLSDIQEYDISNYIFEYQKVHPSITNRSLENMRLCFSSFFKWAFITHRTNQNLMLTFNRIKYDYIVKEPLSDEEREVLYCNANNIRDIAIMEFLYSTAVRVSELVNLNISDVKLKEKELKVFGKGNKERMVYLNAKASLYLSQYLNSRTDNNQALFVSLKEPHNRLTVSGIEGILRRIGATSGIKNVHPHRFRRTSATNALNRGMELQYVQKMLGHSSSDTTLLYCRVQDNNVKMSHNKYLAA